MVEGVVKHSVCFFEFELGVWSRLTGELFFHLFDVIVVDVAVTTRPDELPNLKTSLLCEHVGKQRVGGDVKRYTQEHVSGTLVDLDGKFPVCDIELEHGVAGHKSHVVKVCDVPRGNNVSPGVWVCFEKVHGSCDLVDEGSVVVFPGSPLGGVDRAEVTVFVRPFVPDVDVVVVEPCGISVACQEPEEFAYDTVEVDFFGGDKRE